MEAVLLWKRAYVDVEMLSSGDGVVVRIVSSWRCCLCRVRVVVGVVSLWIWCRCEYDVVLKMLSL